MLKGDPTQAQEAQGAMLTEMAVEGTRKLVELLETYPTNAERRNH